VEQNPQASVIQPVIYTRLIDPSQYGPPAIWQRETRATGWTIETEEQETEQLAEFALYVLAVANVSRYRFDAALRFLHAMNNRDAMALFFVGVCHAVRQESTEAMQTFDEVLAIDQNFFAAAAFGLVVREQTGDLTTDIYARDTSIPLIIRISQGRRVSALEILADDPTKMPEEIKEEALLIPKNVQDYLFSQLLAKLARELRKRIPDIQKAVDEGATRMQNTFRKLEIGQLKNVRSSMVFWINTERIY
jgi:hypothetical protein